MIDLEDYIKTNKCYCIDCGKDRSYQRKHLADKICKSCSNSINVKGRIPWNKGLKTGKPAWNRGLDTVDPIQYKIKRLLRIRLYTALNSKSLRKRGSAVKDLGCTIEEFKKHIESKWLSGMSWGNHSLYDWHLDHIRPLSGFKLENRDELLKACHYTNIQPLWAKDNLSKSNKIIGS